MTTVTVKKNFLGSDTILVASWELTNADTGDAVALPDWADKSIQVAGTFGGATVTIEGSNDGVNFATLRDPSGAFLTFTSAQIKQVLEMTLYLRASSSGGTGTDVIVTMAARMDRPLIGD
jgi:hypothetical protein